MIKKKLIIIIVALSVSVVLAGIGFFLVNGFSSSPQTLSNSELESDEGSVLGLEFYPRDLATTFDINIPSLFNDSVVIQGPATFNGGIEIAGVTVDFTTFLTQIRSGDGISISTGAVPTISNSGVTSLGGETGEVKLTAGNGIEINGNTITNNDKGTDLKTYSTINVNGTVLQAGTHKDALIIDGGTGITIDGASNRISIRSNVNELQSITGWTQSTNTIHLTDITDSVGIGIASTQSKLYVKGSDDVTQLVVQGASSQTSNIVEFHDHQGTTVVSFDNGGNAVFAGTITQAGFELSGNGLSFTGDGTDISLDATTSEPDNLLTNSTYESDISDWDYTIVKKEQFSNPTLDANISGWQTNGSETLTNAEWYDNSWLYRNRLVFDNSEQTENLTNFPVMVKLEDGVTIDYDKVQNQGEDIRFTDADGTTTLAYEIEDWNEGGTSYIWVRVPQVDGSSDSDAIYMYYGNPSASDNQSPSDVWDSATYNVVWNMSDDAANLTVDDSTSNNKNGTAQQTTATVTTPGKIGKALSFNGTTSTITSTVTLPAATKTISLWVYLNSSSSKSRGQGILYSFPTFNPHYMILERNGDLVTYNYGRVNTTDIGSGTNYSTVNTIATGSWQKIDIVHASGQETVYVNGNAGVPATLSAVGGVNGGLKVSHSYWSAASLNQGFLDGNVDALRVATVQRSPDWIAASYLSESGTFTTFSGEESRDAVGSINHSVAQAFDSSLGSSFINATNDDVFMAQSINVISSEAFVLEAYAYTDGSPVTSAHASLYYDDAPLNTTYTSADNGWYRLSADIGGVNTSVSYGATVKQNTSVFIDELSLQIADTSTKVRHSTNTTYNSSVGSAQVDTIGLTPTSFSQDIVASVAGTHTFSARVYNSTPGSVGGTIDSSIAQLTHNGVPIVAPVYQDVGSGWWLIEASKAIPEGSNTFAIEVATDKIVFVDTTHVSPGRGDTKTISIVNSGTGLAKLVVESTTTLNTGVDTEHALVIKGVENQIANLVEWRDFQNNTLGVIDENGRVGIGTTNPSYALQIGSSGDGTQGVANAWNTFSDIRYKEDISAIDDPLALILGLEGVTYTWKNSGESSVGFIAQDVEKILPEIVSTDADGYKSLDYSKLSPVLVEAIKAQQQDIRLLYHLLGITSFSGSEAASLLSEQPIEFDELSGSFIFEDDVNVLGAGSFEELHVMDLLTTGLIQIDSSSNAINTLGVSCYSPATNRHDKDLCVEQELHLQRNMSGNVNFFDGNIKFYVDGTIEAEGLIIGTTAGRATIPAGQNYVSIPAEKIEENSHVFVTPLTVTDQTLSVTEIRVGDSFKVEIKDVTPQDIEFNWWYIN